MQRDPELICKILLAIEEHPHGNAPRLKIDGYTREQVGYHVWLLGDAGLLNVSIPTSLQSVSPEATPVSMTSSGHDFLDAARNDTVWKKVTKTLREKLGPVPIEVLKTALTSELACLAADALKS